MTLFEMAPSAVPNPRPRSYSTAGYPYLCADGAAAAHPLFQAGEGGSIPTSALQLRFEPIDLTTARQLNASWHSVLPHTHHGNLAGGGVFPASCFVAEYEERWFAVAIWTGPVNRSLAEAGPAIAELRRLAICPVAPKNTASRMLGFMTRDLRRRFPLLERLISYQATDIHAGTIYKAAGWEPIGFTTYAPWSNRRPRGVAQTTSDKVRWELRLR